MKKYYHNVTFENLTGLIPKVDVGDIILYHNEVFFVKSWLFSSDEFFYKLILLSKNKNNLYKKVELLPYKMVNDNSHIIRKADHEMFCAMGFFGRSEGHTAEYAKTKIDLSMVDKNIKDIEYINSFVRKYERYKRNNKK